VYHNKRPVERRRFQHIADQQWPDGSGRTGEQRLAIRVRRIGQPSLEQLVHDTKREFQLEFGSAPAQHLIAGCCCAFARNIDERRLANPDATFDQENAAGLLKCGADGSQLTLAFA
jgi:hypothetical protein